jgi:hypothetical protein
MAKQGVYARVIAERTGLTIGQIYERCRQFGISTTDRRKGNTEEVRAILDKYSTNKITARTFNALKSQATASGKFKGQIIKKK